VSHDGTDGGYDLRRGDAVKIAALALALFAAACRTAAAEPVAPAADPRCDNDRVPLAPAILVVVAHPDDDVTAFAGVIHDGVRRGATVRVAFATHGQANCHACALHFGHTCTRAELDELGRVRRYEALAGLAILGVNARDVVHLGFDDGTLGAAWTRPTDPPALPRCGDDEASRTARTGAELRKALRELVVAEPWAAVFTTHPLDGHPDHAAVARFVAATLAELDRPPPQFAAVLHTRGQHDCTWPAPPHPHPECASGKAPPQPTTLRYRPDAWLEPPIDAPYGDPILYCLDARPLKRRAIEAHRSQMGPADVAAAMLAFVRVNEVLYRLDPADVKVR
jgi:LmbE family N-acetylglucosaminyl deacetylase